MNVQPYLPRVDEEENRMPQLRQDPSTNEWVIIAKERAKRPEQFRKDKKVVKIPQEKDSGCPFCPGNEHMTPAEVLAYRNGGGINTPDWRVRVIPNKYAALLPEGDLTRTEQDDFFRWMDGVGQHEVIIETRFHNRFIYLMEEREVGEVILAYRERYHCLRQDPRYNLIIIFKNHGEAAGTSLEHPHSQIVATPVVPAYIRRKYAVATQYYDNTGRCLYCDMVEKELKDGSRIVMESKDFIVFHPFASRSPFETVIAPRRHCCSFGDISDEEVREFARILSLVLKKIQFGLNEPDFNYIIHTAPTKDENKDYYLWHLQLLPRLTTAAGFELGSGIYINTALPEETAAYLRSVSIE
jgi:UDPglucose--hexose-1-phosphate uridylyltransferase